MTRRSTTLLLTESEAARLCAEGFVTIGDAARDLGYSDNYLRKLCARGGIYHRRDRTPGATRDSIRIPVVALREFKQRIVPLKNQVLAVRRVAI
jgi:hypothetical protein